MASTSGRLDICNMALGFIGTRTIASIDERTPEAVQCGLYWDAARRAALRDYPYRFAQRRAYLAARAVPETYASQWRCCYGVPDGCLKIHAVHTGTDGAPLPAPWTLVGEEEGMVLLTNVGGAMADMTVDVKDVSAWDELFVMAMARRLAVLVAVPLLKNNSGKMQELMQLYQTAVPQAEGQDAGESEPRRRPDAWLLAREAW